MHRLRTSGTTWLWWILLLAVLLVPGLAAGEAVLLVLADWLFPLLVIAFVVFALWASGLVPHLGYRPDPHRYERATHARRYERFRRRTEELERTLRDVKVYYRHPTQAAILEETVARLERSLAHLRELMARERAIEYSLRVQSWLDDAENLLEDGYRWETEAIGSDVWDLQSRIRQLLDRVHRTRPLGRQLLVRVEQDAAVAALNAGQELCAVVRATLRTLEILRSDLIAARGELESEAELSPEGRTGPEESIQYVIQRLRMRSGAYARRRGSGTAAAEPGVRLSRRG